MTHRLLRHLLIGLVVLGSLATFRLLVGLATHNGSGRLPFSDFMVFWASGPVVREHGLPALFDTTVFTAYQNAMFAEFLGKPLRVRPWLYPPSFLWIASAFSWLPLYLSATVMQLGGVAALWLATGRQTGRWLLVLTSPAVGALLIPGQLTAWLAAGMVGGCMLLGTRPVLAGIVWGLLSVKPHLFALIPIALLAAKAWRALTACLLTALVLIGVSLVLYGGTAWILWLDRSTGAAQVVLRHYDRYADAMGSILDGVRTFGAGNTVAWAAQSLALVGAGCSVWWVFRRSTALAPRILILTSATLVASPYWLAYDLILPTLAIAVAAREDGDAPSVPGESVVWLLAWTLPYAMTLMRGLYGLPIGPLVMVALWLVTLTRRDAALRPA
jgi:hypothetical protein